MKRLLVTGTSGFLGWNLCQYARTDWEVYGTYFSHEVKIPGATLYRTNLTDVTALNQLFDTVKPDAVIHTAAASKPDFCETHRQESYDINVGVSVNIARLCSDLRIPCAFTSTDMVFDGNNAPYSETDPVSPITYYGEQKAIAEQKMSEIYPAIALCRMPLMFGAPSPVSPSFLQGTIENLRTGNKMNLFIDEFRTPASARAASQGLLLAIERRVAGILHLGGKERISRYDFGLLVADVWQLSPDAIISAQQADVATIAARSPDTSLDSSKAFTLGYQPLSLREELICLR